MRQGDGRDDSFYAAQRNKRLPDRIAFDCHARMREIAMHKISRNIVRLCDQARFRDR